MKQFFTVFKFEFMNFLKNKVFIVLTVIMAIVIAVLAFIPRFTSGTDISLNFGGDEKQTVLISDQSGIDGTTEILKSVLTDYEVIIDNDKDINIIKEEIAEEKYHIAIFISSPLEYKYIVNNLELYDTTSYMVNEVLTTNYKNHYLLNAGLAAEELTEYSQLAVKSESVIVGQDQSQSFFLAYVLIMVLYMAVLIYGQIVAQSVATEKSSRAMELLITSADPKSLIFGKVLGTGFAGLSQITFLLLWALGCITINRKYLEATEIFSLFSNVSPSLIVYTIIFFVLGFALYAFLLGAMGSMASKLEEVGTLTMPVMVLFIIAFMVTITFTSSGNMDSIIMVVCSYIPFTAPMAMFARIAMGTANTLEAIISIAILIVSNYLTGKLAVAIYRIGILMYGKPPKFNEIVRALKKK